MNSRLVVVLTALLTVLSGIAKAEEPEPCPFGVEEAINLSETQLGQLYQTRGISRPSEIGTVPRELKNAIGKYLALLQMPAEIRPNALIAFLSKDEVVCAIVSLVGRGGRDVQFDMILLPKSASQISLLVDRNVDELLAGGPTVARAPVLRKPDATRSAETLSQTTDISVRPPSVILKELADAIFPYDQFLPVDGEVGSLSIIPALNLGRVPFSAFDLNGDGKPLVVSAPINVESSLKSVLDFVIYKWTPGFQNPVVFGDPNAEDDPDWILPRLPGADREAHDVAKLLGAQPTTGQEATKPRFLEEIEAADYIHVAAHGIASASDPMDGSFVALTGARLTAREIQHLKLTNNPVVVLSACQTALGGPLHAGIIGISRAFLIAGGVNVVSSLWNIDDAATSEIMLAFVKNLSQTNPANALRLAQVEAREKWPDPRIWSAFVVYGARMVSVD